MLFSLKLCFFAIILRRTSKIVAMLKYESIREKKKGSHSETLFLILSNNRFLGIFIKKMYFGVIKDNLVFFTVNRIGMRLNASGK